MAEPIIRNIGDWLEQYTYEYLLMMGLSQVPDAVDKRQGSIIWDAIAPAAYVIAEIAAQMRQVYRDTFVSTASGVYLDLRTAEIGLTRQEATYAVRKGYFYGTNGALMDVPIGSRYAARNNENNLTFKVTSELASAGEVHETGVFLLDCEQAGTIGNQYNGDLIPITNVPGLAQAILGELIITARDLESDDDLRARFFEKMNEKPFGGNVAQYKLWMQDIIGVGASQIYPIWDGGGTVLISIINDDYLPVPQEFIDIVQRQIDPQGILPNPIYRRYGGNPMNFVADANKIYTVRILGKSTQAGSGVPSFTNPRPITGIRQNPSIYVNGTQHEFNTNAPGYSVIVNGEEITDSIFKTNGLALSPLTRNTDMFVLSSSDNWIGENVATSYMVYMPHTNLKITQEYSNTMSSHFIGITKDQKTAGTQGCCVVDRNGSALALVFEAGTGVSSVASFKTWLDSQAVPVQVVAQLETPEVTDMSGIEDIPNPGGTVIISADDDANLTVRVIEKVDTSQLGLGIAPIGHKVTVVTPEELEIDIQAVIICAAGYDPAAVQPSVKVAIEYYFSNIRKDWGNSSDLNQYSSVVYQSNVIVQILSVPGVTSVTSCLLNGAAHDIILQEDSTTQQIPSLGAVILSA